MYMNSIQTLQETGKNKSLTKKKAIINNNNKNPNQIRTKDKSIDNEKFLKMEKTIFFQRETERIDFSLPGESFLLRWHIALFF